MARGTAWPAAIPGAVVGAKTGTAEKNAETSDGWFVGFAQMDGRTVVVAIVLEDSGSGVAAGRAHDVFLAALDALAHR